MEEKATSTVAEENKSASNLCTFSVTEVLPAVANKLRSCLLDMIQGKVEEQAPCCALWETDMDWGRTSQVPELGFLCQPVMPTAHPGACWQGKFPKLPTSDVTLITHGKHGKGGQQSGLLSLAFLISVRLELLPQKNQTRRDQSSRFPLSARL